MKELGTSVVLISKISTMTDGGLRVTLDLSSDNLELIQKLLPLVGTHSTIFATFIEKN